MSVTPADMLDACVFAQRHLSFTPDPLQARVLDRCIHRGILNCTRQWGKSTVTAVKALHRAWTEPETLVLVASPSARQTSEFVRKVAALLRRLNVRVRGDGDHAISLLLPNESRIVGLPGQESVSYTHLTLPTNREV